MHEPPSIDSENLPLAQAPVSDEHGEAAPGRSEATSDAVANDQPARSRRREGLQAFQNSLFARMDAASSEDLQSRRLAVNIGGVLCLINLAEAGEIVPLSSLSAPMSVPLTQPWYLGMVNIRGNLVGIVDLAAQAGRERQVPDRDSRVLVFAPALSPNCGLLLSSVMGLRQLSEMHVIQKKLNEETELIGIVERYKDRGGTEWNEIGLATLLNDAAFLQIGR
ncbi:chemotaxis protein CheW [Herbaspirillum sp. LeCh32-8]|uniref:chemotaxis protein CheW n=1 Tax=Herbaspirillum sp. LeCh32-8 TaxID=2821356 RepID=UPI001AE6C2B0|nr:chemotaxis protein CheW [Herbaspirillum sp. LeCh32-8]MBP0600483.1 chemotaxis protein CheW [Herbaspirillum sp. LeCh32-8]